MRRVLQPCGELLDLLEQEGDPGGMGKLVKGIVKPGT